MNLSEMIDFFKLTSGRHNLSSEQIRHLLNAGAVILHSKLLGIAGEVMHMVGLQTGMNTINLSKYLGAVNEVFMVGTENSASRLYTRLIPVPSITKFLETFPDLSATGVPTHYCLVPPVALADADDVSTAFLDTEYWTTENFGSGASLTVLFNCPAQERVDLRVLGTAQLKTLVKPTDTNYISINFPELLYHGALYIQELSNKSFIEASTLLSIIEQLITSINLSSIEAKSRMYPREIE